MSFLCSDKADLTEETLLKQYEVVKRRTSNNYTYNMGSHVMQFGSLAIDEEPVADYLGELNTGALIRCTASALVGLDVVVSLPAGMLQSCARAALPADVHRSLSAWMFISKESSNHEGQRENVNESRITVSESAALPGPGMTPGNESCWGRRRFLHSAGAQATAAAASRRPTTCSRTAAWARCRSAMRTCCTCGPRSSARPAQPPRQPRWPRSTLRSTAAAAWTGTCAPLSGPSCSSPKCSPSSRYARYIMFDRGALTRSMSLSWLQPGRF